MAAGNITGAMVEGGKALQRAGKAFERNFSAGTATPENIAKAAADMGAVVALMLVSAFSINAEPREPAKGGSDQANYSDLNRLFESE